MKLKFLQTPRVRSVCASALLLTAFVANNSFAQTAATAQTQTAAALSAAEQELAARVNVETIKQVTADLSAPEMQGRGTMQAGGDKAANYIADRFQKIGLKPLGDKSTFLQKIKFRENVFAPETSFKIGDEQLKMGDDYVIQSSPDKTTSGEMIFIGYAMVVDAMKRNDLGDLNLQNKIVVMLQGRPPRSRKAIGKKPVRSGFLCAIFSRKASPDL